MVFDHFSVWKMEDLDASGFVSCPIICSEAKQQEAEEEEEEEEEEEALCCWRLLSGFPWSTPTEDKRSPAAPLHSKARTETGGLPV